MPFKTFRPKCYLLLMSFILIFVTGCNPFVSKNTLEKIQQHDEIIMGTINGTLTYSYEGSQYSGFDYELGQKFAKYLNVNLKVREYDSLTALFSALEEGKIDFIGAGLTLTPERAKKYNSSPPYYYVSQQVVYYKGTYRPRKVEDIEEPIAVLEHSSHLETMKGLLGQVPDLQIEIQKNEDQESLLRQVANKEIKFAVVDSTTLAQKQRYYPELAKAFTLSEQLPVSWLINRDRDNTLYSALIEFMGNARQDQTITKLQEKYFGHVERFDFVDTKIFLNRIKTIFPKYKDIFKRYATAEVDWLLLASVSYQESHWNPRAKSPTGVRGMMMLTLNTAKSLGIQNRLSTKQSIKGGAKYLSQLINRLPNSIAKNEKVWFALASYNLGYGHVMDARRITVMRKQDPNSWADVKDNLPLLHQKKWYKKTRYGYARGKEAQRYVNNIRQYKKTLTWFIAVQKKQAEAAKKAKLAKQKAEEEAKKLALESPLTPEQLLANLEKTISTKEQSLKQAESELTKIDQALEEAKKKEIVEDNALNLTEQHILSLQQSLKEAADKVLAAQKAFQMTRDSITAEQQTLQKAEQEAIATLAAYQQAKNNVITEQQAYQQKKNKLLFEQQQFLNEKNKALNEKEKLQESLNTAEENEEENER